MPSTGEGENAIGMTARIANRNWHEKEENEKKSKGHKMARKTWKFNGQNLPEKFCAVIALLKFDDIPPIAAIGFVAETVDTQMPYFHCLLGDKGYGVSLIAKWDYLEDVAPQYSLFGKDHR